MEKNDKNKNIIQKVGKIILCIVIILIILFVMNIIRNNIILSDVLKKESSILLSNNIYYEITDREEKTSKFYKKDGIEMLDITTNGHRMIQWRNTNTNEGVIVYPQAKIAINTKADEMLGFNVPLLVYSSDEIEMYRKCMMLSCVIYTEKLNDIPCYVIMNDFNNKTWVAKETGVVLKRQSGTIENESGEKSSAITYYNNWKINELTESDLKKPDVSGFEIRDNN